MIFLYMELLHTIYLSSPGPNGIILDNTLVTVTSPPPPIF